MLETDILEMDLCSDLILVLLREFCITESALFYLIIALTGGEPSRRTPSVSSFELKSIINYLVL